MSSMSSGITAFLKSYFAWTERPDSMRPKMRKRRFLGVNQCEIWHEGRWQKAPYPATRYQWTPRVRKVVAAVAILNPYPDLNASKIIGDIINKDPA